MNKQKYKPRVNDVKVREYLSAYSLFSQGAMVLFQPVNIQYFADTSDHEF